MWVCLLKPAHALMNTSPEFLTTITLSARKESFVKTGQVFNSQRVVHDHPLFCKLSSSAFSVADIILEYELSS